MLTPTQLEYLALYASGNNTLGIADVRYMSASSVRKTLRLAQSRCGANSLTHCVALAIDKGWLEVQKDSVVVSSTVQH